MKIIIGKLMKMSEEYNLTKSKNNEECIMYKRTIKNEPNNIKMIK